VKKRPISFGCLGLNIGAAHSPNTGIGVVIMKFDEVGNDVDGCEGDDMEGIEWDDTKADGFNERFSRSADNWSKSVYEAPRIGRSCALNKGDKLKGGRWL
jgi:hypothetical protein